MLRDWVISHLPDYVLTTLALLGSTVDWINSYIIVPAFVIVLLILYVFAFKANPGKTTLYSLAFIGFITVLGILSFLYQAHVVPVYNELIYRPFIKYIYNPYMEHVFNPYLQYVL